MTMTMTMTTRLHVSFPFTGTANQREIAKRNQKWFMRFLHAQRTKVHMCVGFSAVFPCPSMLRVICLLMSLMLLMSGRNESIAGSLLRHLRTGAALSKVGRFGKHKRFFLVSEDGSELFWVKLKYRQQLCNEQEKRTYARIVLAP
jgi:hypothetical protein